MRKPTKKQIQTWIDEIRSHPSDAFYKREYEPRDNLAKHGTLALPLVFESMSAPYPDGTHPRDVVEALSTVLHTIAKEDPTPLIEALENEAAPADPYLWLVVHALGSAKKKSLVVDPLISALKHKNQYVRDGAVQSLLRLRYKKSIPPLIDTIRDRSSLVRFSIVKAINTIDFFRDRRAIPNVKRLLARKNLSPGTRRHAEEALKRLEEESQGEDVSHVSYAWTDFNDRRILELPEMPQLRSMDLSDTQVSDTGLKELKRFPQLRVLNLNNTRATAAGMRCLKALTMLESLDIGGIGFNGKAGLAHLAHLSNLRELDLGGTGVKDTELAYLKNFKALTSLQLFFTTGDVGLGYVSWVKTLECLRLYRVPISDDGIKHLARLKKLQKLRIEHCPITDASCPFLQGLKRLESLQLHATGISEAGIASLRESLPDCEIKT